MLVLTNWLFRPVLKVLDERKKKLDDARAKKSEYEAIQIQQQKELEEKRAEFHRLQKEAANEEVMRIQADEKTQIKLAHEQTLENICAYREELESNHRQIVEALSPKMSEVAEIFANQIISYRT